MFHCSFSLFGIFKTHFHDRNFEQKKYAKQKTNNKIKYEKNRCGFFLRLYFFYS